MRNTLTEWERFTGFLKRNGVPVYRVCGGIGNGRVHAPGEGREGGNYAS